MNLMNIAILGIKGVPGSHGVEVVVDNLIQPLQALGHRVTVYGYASYTQPYNDYKGARVQTVHGSSHPSLEMVTHMLRASLRTRAEQYDLIHIHSVDPCILAWLPKSRYGVMATSHGQAYFRKKWGLLARTMSRIAEHFFIHVPKVKTSVSRPLADYYLMKYGKKVEYIPNGITPQDKPKADILSKFGVKAGNFLFCAAGRMERTKGVHTLLEAYSKLNTGYPLLIAGGGIGSDKKYFDELKRNAPENVFFLGFLTGESFLALYAHARVFVFPSEYEAMSMSLLEGMSFGTPTVYSDIPENKAVADALGFSFVVSDSDSLSQVIQYVLDHYEEGKEVGAKAKKYIEGHHNWLHIAQKYSEFYNSIM